MMTMPIASRLSAPAPLAQASGMGVEYISLGRNPVQGRHGEEGSKR